MGFFRWRQLLKGATVLMMSSNARQFPKVGVGVVITSPKHPGCVVVGKRIGSTGSGQFGLPGGHLEFGEEWAECAARETLEETGMTIKNITFGAVVNGVIMAENYHYITIFMKGEVDYENGPDEPINTEPEKCEGWQWYEWSSTKSFPSSLFIPLQLVREQGYNPFQEKS